MVLVGLETVLRFRARRIPRLRHEIVPLDLAISGQFTRNLRPKRPGHSFGQGESGLSATLSKCYHRAVHLPGRVYRSALPSSSGQTWPQEPPLAAVRGHFC